MARSDLPTAQLVAELRARSRTTQEELARRLGVSFSTVNAWEAGRSEPQPRHRRRLEQMASGFAEDDAGLKVLVVDDDPTDLRLIEALVADAAAVLGTAAVVVGESDAMRALITLGRMRPAVVFMDVIMPGLDGFELADRIAELGGFDGPRLVLVTAGRDPAIDDEAARRGLTILGKPLVIGEIGAVLRELASFPARD